MALDGLITQSHVTRGWHRVTSLTGGGELGSEPRGDDDDLVVPGEALDTVCADAQVSFFGQRHYAPDTSGHPARHGGIVQDCDTSTLGG